jgi:Carboxypeptidase regulatory-like domain
MESRLIILAAAVWLALTVPASANDPSSSLACTGDAKLCPDGSGVSRTGPNCEFAACPSTASTKTGRIEGQIVLYPASPVARAGEPNQRGIPGQVVVVDATGTVVTQVTSDSKGLFQVDLPPGRYTLRLASTGSFGSSEPQPVTIESGRVTKTVLTFDAGIR